ncbi:MAG: restriction endonuclease subunit S, partial [Deltaproteobacteria bacterium]|nr:restriction endonuclease subunit S [Deltaproteobacteria bacterium]
KISKIEELISKKRRGLMTGPFGSMLKKSEHIKSGIPVLGIENIGFMEFIYGTKIYITIEKANQLLRYKVLPRDVIISRSGTVGEVCVVPNDIGEARFSTNIIRVALDNKKIDPNFFCYLFSGAPFILDQIAGLCKGSTRDFLNQNILKSISFPLPSIQEQREIVKQVEALFRLIKKVESRYKKTKAQIDKLTQSILAKAFRGELVPQDPNDEPASELLKRIKAEKAKTIAESKTQKTETKTTRRRKSSGSQ